MEEKNNKDTYVHDILSMIGAKKGDRFYCTVCGYVALDTNGEESLVFSALKSEETKCFTTRPDGKMYETGEVIVFPSKTMQDWGKLEIAKGDVVVSDEGNYAIFEKWAKNSGYSRMFVRHIITPKGVYSDNGIWLTECSSRLEPDSMCERNYLKQLQNEHGILNPETLELKKRPEFKDGDIVFVECEKGLIATVFIYKADDVIDIHDEPKCYAALFTNRNELSSCGSVLVYGRTLRLATDSEKQQLFDALAKKNKAWDEDKKEIEDLQKKCEFEPMDWCLMRMHRCIWRLCQFSSYSDVYSCNYIAVGGNAYEECIPYNEETKHLLGTKEYEA